MGLRILLTNLDLRARTGTAVYVRDLAHGLLRRGHLPVVYSPRLGPVAEEIRQTTIPVLDDLERLAEAPDLIHGHHHPQTMAAILRFPRVPALFVCHDRLSWHDEPPHHPSLVRYVAVDYNCLDRLTCEGGVPPEKARVLYNAVDLRRFRPRAPLPERPRRALVFSNASLQVAPIAQACARVGLELDQVSALPRHRPEEALGDYDLVFAKARCALEAMAVGCAVVVCDHRGLAELVTPTNFEAMRRLNFGMRLLQRPLRPELLQAEIERYRADQATQVAERVRTEADLGSLVEQWEELYHELLAEPGLVYPDEEGSRAASRYVAAQVGRIPREGGLAIMAHGLGQVLETLRRNWKRLRG